MTGETLPQGEVIGIVIGAIVLFSIISIVPIMIMWYHRRRAAARTTNEIHDLTLSMQQPSVEQWLEGQNSPRDIEHPICLSSLSSSPYLVLPEPARLPHGQRKASDSRSGESSYTEAKDCRQDSGILVLNRCHHPFHTACIASWFEYRHYRCPICQASYSPADTA
ncbi:uncharacterized protein N7473_005343 [Penicillium subrubescens]|uniref:uncharacterized protein n=1 Tax=Penicillium subrubescens TaxID=1316194 RepID=UPI00254592DC|nr:uncharacterized protein N7473_005343 [Penicillium subrubescens]KAJ5895944.1 hypothetical protein N7473_005343 [Penicillium subrubescens]